MINPKPILIAQISDLHIKPKGTLAYGRVNTAHALEQLIDTLNRLSPTPDLVVISGDLVDGGTQTEYAHLKEHLAHLRLPYAVTAGNHDNRVSARSAFSQQNFADGLALNQVQHHGELDVILLDSSVPGEPHGWLEKETLEWLNETLSESALRPALLFLHHPPFATGIGHMDSQCLRNPDDLAALIQRHPRVQLVAAGHAHRSIFTSFAGVTASVCPAPNHAVALDLDGSLVPSLIIEPPAFHLHAWFTHGQHLVTHHIPVGIFEGPHPFFSPDGKLL